MNAEEDESGATATVMLVGKDMLFIAHAGDSCLVCIQHLCSLRCSELHFA